MRNLRTLTLGLALLLLSLTAAAAPVGESTARAVARNFIATRGIGTGTQLQLQKSPYANLYLYTLQGRTGFVIIGASTSSRPVVGYSTTSPLGDTLPPAAAQYLGAMDRAIAYREQHDTAEAYAFEWRRLIEGHTTKGTVVVSPLVETSWDQGYSYNRMCPIAYYAYSGTMEHCLTGCAATAMAQIMRYWQHPSMGAALPAYTWQKKTSSTTTKDTSLSITATTFDWANMKATTPYTDANRTAIGTLMYYCGVGLKMNYGTDGSSAVTTDAVNVLKNYLDYNSTTTRYIRHSAMTDAVWLENIQNELDAARPVIYTGRASDGSGGHAFVCDGYDSDDLLHFNWGWSGAGDGYYAIDNLMPTELGYGSGEMGDYTYQNYAIIGIEPNISKLSATPSSLEFSCWGESLTTNVRSGNSDATAWSIASKPDWLSLTPTTGSGSGALTTLTLTATHNTTGSTRQGYVVLQQGSVQCTISVQQPDGTVSAAGCGYGISSGSLGYTIIDGGELSIIRPEAFGNFGTGQQLTSLTINTYHTQATTDHFWLRIYEDCQFNDDLQTNGYTFDVASALGTLAYSQYFELEIYKNINSFTINLDSPYTITAGKTFWVAVYASDSLPSLINYSASNDSRTMFTSTNSDGDQYIYAAQSYPMIATFCIADPCTNDTVVYNLAACDSLAWRGSTYKASGAYNKSVPFSNGSGCDTVLTLNLTVKPSSATVESHTACGQLRIGSTTYNTSQLIKTYSGTAANGCDSTHSINLTISPEPVAAYYVAGSGAATWRGTTYTASGTYTMRYPQAAGTGCDSLITLYVDVTAADGSSLATGSPAMQQPAAYAHGGMLTVKNATGLDVDIVDAQGRIVAHYDNAPSHIALTLPHNGIYIVRAGQYRFKVISM